MTANRTRLAGMAFALMVGIVAAIAALAWSSGGQNSATAALVSPPPGVASLFGVLRVPDNVDSQGLSPFANASRLAPGIESSAVHVVTIGKDQYSVAATSTMVCMDSHRAGSGASSGGCASTAGVEANGFFTGSHAAPNGPNAGETSITGLVPDGVDTVGITLAGGKTATLDAHTNVVAGTFTDEPLSARFVMPDGHDVVAKLREG